MKYGKEMTDRICDAIKQLKGRVGASKTVGISFDTFCQWMKKSEFSEAVKKAEAEAGLSGKEMAIMSIFKAMPTQWQAGAWWLERKHRDEFARREEHTGANGTPLMPPAPSAAAALKQFSKSDLEKILDGIEKEKK